MDWLTLCTTIVASGISLWAAKTAVLARKGYWQLFTHASDAILRVNRQTGQIVDANAAATAMLGVERHQLLREPMVRFLRGDSAEAAFRLLSADSGEGGPISCILSCPDGRQLPADLRVVQAPDRGRRHCLVHLRDQSDRQRHANEISKHRSQLHQYAGLERALLDIHCGTRPAAGTQDLCRAVVYWATLGMDCGLDRALLLLMDDDGRPWLTVRTVLGFFAGPSGEILSAPDARQHWELWRTQACLDPGQLIDSVGVQAREMEDAGLQAASRVRLPAGILPLFDSGTETTEPKPVVISADDARWRALGDIGPWLCRDAAVITPIVLFGQPAGLLVADSPYSCGLQIARSRPDGMLASATGLSAVAGHMTLMLEHIQLHDRLRETEERYRDLIDCVREGICLVDLESGRVLRSNAAMVQLSGFSDKDLTGMPLVALCWDEDMAQHQAILSDLRSHGHVTWQTRLRRKDATMVWVELRASLVETRPLPIAMVMYLDMTAQRRAEESIRSFARFPLADPNIVMKLSAEGDVLFMNPAAHRLLSSIGIQTSEAPQLVPEPLRQQAGELSETGGVLLDVEHRVFDRVLSLTIQGVPEDGTINVYGTDVTQRKLLEERLLRAEKMESLGTLASSIAHDFGNVLGSILGHASLVLSKDAPPGELHEALEIIQRAAQYGAGLIRQLQDFSRGGEPVVQPLNVATVVKDTMTILGARFRARIRLEIRCAPDVPLVMADQTQLQTILFNLCINADHAMPNGGTLTLAVQRVEAVHPSCCDTAAPSPHVLLRVSDTGVGMDAQTRARIFERFFTTKARGKGTGQGLATTAGIVTRLGGWINVDSEVGKGTTFDVFLPACEAVPEPEVEMPAQGQTDIAGDNEVILVAEDEDSLRTMVVQFLQYCGYRTFAASDGRAALELFREHADQIDLAVIDMVMPELDGPQLARALRALRPDVRILLSSAQPADEITRVVREEDLQGYVQKPYLVNAFAEAVKAALRQSPVHCAG